MGGEKSKLAVYMAKLLVVEDEIKTARTLQQGLEEHGYSVLVAHDGVSAEELVAQHRFDLIIMDVIIPRLGGLELCKRLRERGYHMPVIMVTALGLTSDKLRGFDSGSDDYLTKPFDFEELLARVKVALGRTRKQSNSANVLEYNGLSLNLDTREAKRDGKSLSLTAKEYALLEFLVRNHEKVVSKDEIAEKVWNVKFDTGTNVVEVYVSYLRNKVDKGFEQKLIHTRKGMGYILREES
jgi:two-component system, OmpR family, copper resistance phosphate regulon response regulator CusR